MSAWRGEARKASAPKRAMSTREATIDIISIAQQARPKVHGKSALAAAQLPAFSSVVEQQAVLDVLLQLRASSSPRSIWRARSCRARKSPSAELPRLWRFTSIRAPPSPYVDECKDQQAMKTIVSTSANVPNAFSWMATG